GGGGADPAARPCDDGGAVGQTETVDGGSQAAIVGGANGRSADSKCLATARARSSRQSPAAICTPIGRPSADVPARTTAAGQPVRLWVNPYPKAFRCSNVVPWGRAGTAVTGDRTTSKRSR